MGLFNLRKSKSSGWDEEAATEFHSKAPAANQPSKIPLKVNGTKVKDASAEQAASKNTEEEKLVVVSEGRTSASEVSSASSSSPENTTNTDSDGVETSTGETNTEEEVKIEAKDADTPVDAVNEGGDTDASANQDTAPAEVAASEDAASASAEDAEMPAERITQTLISGVRNSVEPRVSATPIANIHNTRTSDAPQTDSMVPPGTLPKQAVLDRAAMEKFIEGYSDTTGVAISLGGKLENYLSGVVVVVQELNAKLLIRQNERTRLTEKLSELRTEIDLLEQNGPEFDKNLRKLTEDLNVELTKDYVEGVARVEIPQYGAANELVDVISLVGQKFAKMLPALETSKEGALGMLQSLTVESRAYAPAKELVDFSIDGIESIKRFLKSHVELRNGLQSALKNYDMLSADYKKTLEESEANLTELTQLVASIKAITNSFQNAGVMLHKSVPKS